MFKIIATQSFFNEYQEFFDNIELNKFEKFKKRLKSYPYLGKPLRVPYIREFKTSKGKRAYFIVYIKFNIILFVGYSNKKKQKDIINDIFYNIEEYKNFAKKFYNS